MTSSRSPLISSRKLPQQARSTRLVEDVLQAAVQVLAKEGAQRFTMARVAEKAGVSVGSLYQYFPNKAAVLFRLQHDEWRQTSELLRGIIEDSRTPPLDRLRSLVITFVHSECDEAQMRTALSDAAPFYRNAPEAKEAREAAQDAFLAFIREVLPAATESTCGLASELILTTLSAAGKHFSETPRTPPEIEAYSNAMADMFCAYLERLRQC